MRLTSGSEERASESVSLVQSLGRLYHILTTENNPWGTLRNKAPPGGALDQGQWPIPEHSALERHSHN